MTRTEYVSLKEKKQTLKEILKVLMLSLGDLITPIHTEYPPISKALWAQWVLLVIENGLLKRFRELTDGRNKLNEILFVKNILTRFDAPLQLYTTKVGPGMVERLKKHLCIATYKSQGF